MDDDYWLVKVQVLGTIVKQVNNNDLLRFGFLSFKQTSILIARITIIDFYKQDCCWFKKGAKNEN